VDEATGGRTAFRRWIERLPRPVRWGLIAVLLLCWYVVVLAALTWIHDEPVDWTEPLPGVLGGFGGASLGLWWQSRRFGGRQRLREYTSALKSGRLPSDADASEWRSVLDREERAGRRTAVFAYAFFGLLAAVFLALGVVRSSGRPGWPLLAGLALFLAVGGTVGWAVGLQRRRIKRLRTQLPNDPIAAP
jgi:hypothetical protein